MESAQETYRQIFNDLQSNDQAAISVQKAGVSSETRVITIALDTAQLVTQPYKINFPFRSFYAQSATDNNVNISVKLSTDDTFQDAFTIKQAQGLDLPFAAPGCSIFWSAQSSKTITLVFFTHGSFKSNITTSSISGQVQFGDGSAVTSTTAGSSTTSAASLFAADTTRIMMSIQNLDTVPIFIGGDASVTTDTGTKPGIKINVGETYEWRSTSACFVISNVATAANKIGLNKFS